MELASLILIHGTHKLLTIIIHYVCHLCWLWSL